MGHVQSDTDNADFKYEQNKNILRLGNHSKIRTHSLKPISWFL